METYTGSEQTQSFSQGGEIQNGNPGNHPDFPSTRRVGHLNRLQRRLLPYTHTPEVAEISQISCPRSDLPVQSTTIWPLNSSYGVHCNSQRSKTDGYKQGYKNPPVPRRLVGESQLPPSLSSTHPKVGPDLSGAGLVSECREVRTRTQTGLRFCRLSVRPPVRPGPTYSGPVANPSGEDTDPTFTAGLSGPAIHVLDRPVNSHRKAGSSRSTAYEAHTVASQKQLEGTRISGENYPITQITTPPLKVVAGGRQCAPRATTTPFKTCSANFYRRVKRRLGHSFKRTHCKRFLVSAGKQVAHKLSGTKSSISSLKGVPGPLCKQYSASGHRQYNSGGLHKQRRRHEVRSTLCPAMENPDLVCQEASDTESPTHPGQLKVVADKLSRLGQTIQTEWSLLPQVFEAICCRWHRPQIDLFATRFNNKLPLFVSPFPDPLASAVDALSLLWEDLDPYAFPPTAILGKVVEKLQDSQCSRIILIAPGWPNMPWFWDLVVMSSQIPLSLPRVPNLLTQPFSQTPHRNLTNLNLHAWLLEPQQSRSTVSLRQWQHELKLLRENQPDQCMKQNGPFLQSGASLIRWTSEHHL